MDVVKVNYKSDFKINEKSERVALEVPFVFSYYVFQQKKYVVSFDGHEYVNCERKEDGSLDVIFNQPDLGIGMLMVERKYFIDDKAFADGVFDVVTTEKAGVYLTAGASFENYIERMVVPPYLKGDKGDAMRWETMTEKEREEMVDAIAEAIDPEMVMTENEQGRMANERERVEAEDERATTFGALKGEMETTISDGQKATEAAQEVVKNYDGKVAEQDAKLSELGSEMRDSSIFELGSISTVGELVNSADGTRIRTKEFVIAKNEDVVYFSIDKGITVSNINVLLYNDGDFVSYEGGAIEAKNGSFSQKLKFDNRVFNQIKVVVACYMATDEKANASQVETPIRNKELKDSIEKNGLSILALSDEIKKSNQQISLNKLKTEGVKSDLDLFKKEFGEQSSFELGTIDTSGVLVEKTDGTRIRTKDYVKVKSGDTLKVSLGIDVTTLNFVLYNDGDFVKYSPKQNSLSKGIYEFEIDDDGVYNQIKIVCSCYEATNEIALSSWVARMVYTPELEQRIDENQKKIDSLSVKSRTYIIDNGVVFDYNFSNLDKKPSLFEANSDWVLSEGHLVNYGYTTLWTNKSITINEKETCIVFNLRNDAEVALAWKSNNWRATGSYMSVTKDLLAIYNCSQEGIKTSVNVSKEIGISLYKDYILKATKNLHENILSLYDGVSGVKIAEISTTQTSTVVENEEFPGGRQMDVLGIQVPSGNAFVKRLNVVSKIKNPLVYIYGDSITEGDRCYDNGTYGYLLKEAIGKDKVALSGQSGSKIYNDGIGGVYDRIVNEITPLVFRPKYIMVTIGTNGGVSQENFNNLKSLIESLGCVPIINVPPIRDYVTEVTREYVLNLNCLSCRFDIATALNYDISQGRNDELFADGAHPNANGQLAMFERMKVDVPELFF